MPGGGAIGALPGAARGRGRWGPIDATRGVAMVFVCLSHFLATYFKGTTYPVEIRFLAAATRLATPTFVLVSGAMLGIAFASRAGTPRAIWLRSVDRGLFLLLVARPLIFLAHVPLAGGLAATGRWLFATDTIAACLVVGPAVVATLGRRARVAAAAVLFAAGWAATALWTPSGALQVAKEVLVGDLHPSAMAYTFPLVQWLAVYLLGTAAGERLWEERRRSEWHAARFAARTGLVSVAVSLAGYAAHRRFQAGTLAEALLAPQHKVPPGAAFVLFYCGAGLLVLAAAAEVERRGLFARSREVIAVLGRNSLVAFVAQYFVYYAAVMVIRPKPSPAWPVWFALSAGAVLAIAAAWDAAGGHRWITVGLAHRTPPRTAAVAADAER